MIPKWHNPDPPICRAIPIPIPRPGSDQRDLIPQEGPCHSWGSLMKPPCPLWVSVALSSPLLSCCWNLQCNQWLWLGPSRKSTFGTEGSPANPLRPPALNYQPALSTWAIKEAWAGSCFPVAASPSRGAAGCSGQRLDLPLGLWFLPTGVARGCDIPKRGSGL